MVFSVSVEDGGMVTMERSSPSPSFTYSSKSTALVTSTSKVKASAVGASFTPMTSIDTVAEFDVHSPSDTVKVNSSVPK